MCPNRHGVANGCRLYRDYVDSACLWLPGSDRGAGDFPLFSFGAVCRPDRRGGGHAKGAAKSKTIIAWQGKTRLIEASKGAGSVVLDVSLLCPFRQPLFSQAKASEELDFRGRWSQQGRRLRLSHSRCQGCCKSFFSPPVGVYTMIQQWNPSEDRKRSPKHNKHITHMTSFCGCRPNVPQWVIYFRKVTYRKKRGGVKELHLFFSPSFRHLIIWGGSVFIFAKIPCRSRQ